MTCTIYILAPNRAYEKVVANKGASGVDGVTVEELGDYIRENKDGIVASITEIYVIWTGNIKMNLVMKKYLRLLILDLDGTEKVEWM